MTDDVQDLHPVNDDDQADAELAEWRRRLDAAVETTLRRRAERAAWRADLDARRRRGLEIRHRVKLARGKPDGGPTGGKR